ncbi:MAG TPA: protein-L-isoaspartate(D-aspartate) O-methyltransferase, partial [Kaistia sp.]|nr:protein-L-isoaspartate(D-aspartate) O-methyltransferase [Kaistia sp.]
MVEMQLARRGIEDPYVLGAFQEVPREAFVRPEQETLAYGDTPLPIGHGQTISQPYIVAFMLEAAQIRPGDRVLDVGAGSGYSAAIASRIAAQVFAIERHRPLGEAARDRLRALRYDNAEVRIGDGTEGWSEAAPFDVILIAAGGIEVPSALKRQLAVGGRLIMPVGDPSTYQMLRRIVRREDGGFTEEDLLPVQFVPLIAESAAADAPAVAPPSARLEALPLPAAIAAVAEPLGNPADPDFSAAFDRFGDCRIVLLGEASHGTSEFYRAR